MFEQTKKWLITVALKKVLRHYTPVLIASVAGWVTAQQLGFVVYSHGYIVINVESGIEWVGAAIIALAAGGGVLDNKRKFEARKDGGNGKDKQ
jgi:hypothetical protein